MPLELIEHIIADCGYVASKLYRFLCGDVQALCALPFDINEIHRVAMRHHKIGAWLRAAGATHGQGLEPDDVAALVAPSADPSPNAPPFADAPDASPVPARTVEWCDGSHPFRLPSTTTRRVTTLQQPDST